MEETRNNIINRWIYIVLSALVVCLAVWGIYNHNKRRELDLMVQNRYNSAFHELVGYVDGIETQLEKSMLASSAAQVATISGEIFRQSTAAKACLGQLPTTTIQLDNTSKFLSQVGDYSYVLSQNMINGTNISDEDYKNLSSLTAYADSLNNSLSKIQEGIFNGEVSFIENRGYNTAKAAGDIFTDLENVEKSFEDYPSLIYDGPFSEHIENQQSEMLKNSPEISTEQAKKKALEFLDGKCKDLNFESDTQNSAISAYTFVSNENDREISISVTKNGGHILYFIDSRSVQQEKLNFSDAIKCAEDFLEKHIKQPLTSSYYDKAGGVATINFAYVQDDVTCYSDLIKIRVALDNGEILGMETHGYIMNNKQREFPSPEISKEQAKAKVNKHLSINSVNMAYIPKDNLEEILCYELQGEYNEKNYIVYINAVNGREEKILMLIESEDGILTA